MNADRLFSPSTLASISFRRSSEMVMEVFVFIPPSYHYAVWKAMGR
jgi:hypothetical protein